MYNLLREDHTFFCENQCANEAFPNQYFRLVVWLFISSCHGYRRHQNIHTITLESGLTSGQMPESQRTRSNDLCPEERAMDSLYVCVSTFNHQLAAPLDHIKRAAEARNYSCLPFLCKTLFFHHYPLIERLQIRV